MTLRGALTLMLALAPALAGCGSSVSRLAAEPPTLGVRTRATDELRALPAPRQPLDVAVFAFQDQTGQHRPNQNFAEYSFAVTQGGASVLINALQDAGTGAVPAAGRWFRVLERNRLADLFQERQIIRANRAESAGPDGRPLPQLGPLRNAGLMITGGIVGYDSDILTGGVGANFLGIGGNVEYRRDNVAVYMRAVSILTGEVLVSVTTDKTIYSMGVQGGANRYVGFNRLLQIDAGVTTNEPRQLAVRQAIEKAVHAVVVEGAIRNYWSFADADAGRATIRSYLETRDGEVPAALADAVNTPDPARRASGPGVADTRPADVDRSLDVRNRAGGGGMLGVLSPQHVANMAPRE